MALVVKKSHANMGDAGSVPEGPLEEEMATTSSLLTWSIHGQRGLVGYSPQGHKESGTPE